MIKGENNKDGKGATFTFVLPLEQGEHKVSNDLLRNTFTWVAYKQYNSGIYVR